MEWTPKYRVLVLELSGRWYETEPMERDEACAKVDYVESQGHDAVIQGDPDRYIIANERFVKYA